MITGAVSGYKGFKACNSLYVFYFTYFILYIVAPQSKRIIQLMEKCYFVSHGVCLLCFEDDSEDEQKVLLHICDGLS